MAKINILPSKVYNRIAAGEVVDRPCSVVKELVENAIDAGATEIEIHIEQGGKQLIRVIDNGCGIEREDLQSAFLPHATSKIAKAEDLENIMTLGFRGEAIASISAVSQMTITSKTENGKCYKLSCNGGEMGQITECSGEKGTNVCVEMLFYHTPVRLGFLKSDKVEEAEITNFVSRFILNRSDISFVYYANGKKLLQSFGGGDEEAMVSVYGASILSDCFCIDAEKHGVRIRGYIGNQNFYKGTKSYQSVFLNGRYIVNATISAAISNAYASYLMKRQYPFYVLHIDIPSEIVDVNVHPNKADVRFADNQIIYGCIYSVISAILDGQSKGMEYIVKMPKSSIFEEAPIEKPIQKVEEQSVPSVSVSFGYEEAKESIAFNAPAFTAKKKGIDLPFELKEEKIQEEEPFDNERARVKIGAIPPGLINDYVSTSTEEDAQAKADGGLSFARLQNRLTELSKATEPSQEEDVFAANKRYIETQEIAYGQQRIDITGCRFAGKLFNTYLLYEREKEVFIIDQHAAHERLIFNRLKDKIDERKIIRQPLLFPYSIEVNAFDGTFLRENLPALTEIGFTITETKENFFEISEIPTDLMQIDLNSFVHDILGHITLYRGIKLDALLQEKLAMAACKAAVKGGMDLTQEEVDTLLVLMDGNMGLKCPHGRPVVVKMTRTELEKKFKRIV